jgi:hypothetical protein
MDSYKTRGDLKEAILKAQEAVDNVQKMLGALHPTALITSEGKSDSRNTDSNACPFLPAIGPLPIHPGGVHCWLTFPLTIGDVINPVRSMSEILGTMLIVIDAGNPDERLPCADGGELIP